MSELITEPTATPIRPNRPASHMSLDDRHHYYNPLMRFLARTLDFTIAAWVLSFALNMLVFLPQTLLKRWLTDLYAYLQAGLTHIVIYGTVLTTSILFIMLLSTCLWCLLVEPWLLSRWGYTPGKYLFNLKVTQLDGQLPSRKDAYGRSWRVWLRGCGAGVPVISLIANIKAYLRLKHTSSTSWDENHFIVTHRKCGWVRKTIIFILFILPIAIWFIILAALIAKGLASL